MFSAILDAIDQFRRWLDPEYNYKRSIKDITAKIERLAEQRLAEQMWSTPTNKMGSRHNINFDKLSMFVLSDPEFDPTPILRDMLSLFLKEHWQFYVDDKLINKYVGSCKLTDRIPPIPPLAPKMAVK